MKSNSRFQGQAVAENRMYPRKKMKLLVHYHSVTQDDIRIIETMSQNISFGGMAIFGERKMSKGELLMVTMYIPSIDQSTPMDRPVNHTDTSCAAVNVLSRVAWSHDHERSMVAMGFQFLHLIVEDRKKLEDFAKTFELLNPDTAYSG